MGIKSTFTKILPLSVFALIIYLNAKTRPKHSLWRKKNNITKNMYFECFSHSYLPKHQNAGKINFYVEKKKTLPQNAESHQ